MDGIHAVHPHEDEIEVECRQCCRGKRADQCIAGRANATGENRGDRVVGQSVEDLGDRRRVGDHREVRDVEEMVGQLPGGGSGGEADGEAGLDQLGRRMGDRGLLVGLACLLGLEARFFGGEHRHTSGATVDLGEQTVGIEEVEIAAHGHVGDLEQIDQFAHAHRAVSADHVENDLVALLGQHVDTLPGGIPRSQQSDVGFRDGVLGFERGTRHRDVRRRVVARVHTDVMCRTWRPRSDDPLNPGFP